MAERYTRVFTLPGSYYCTGSPVVIQAGALLKDNHTGRTVAQLKFKNVSSRELRALTVSLSARDVTGAELAGVEEFSYLDLEATRDEEFGAKIPIVLPQADTRSFSCRCLAAVLADGTVWEDKCGDWDTLPEPVLLRSAVGEWLVGQYHRDTKTEGDYKVTEHKDLWYCTCGAINRIGESFCHKCHTKRMLLTAAEDVETLSTNLKAFEKAASLKRAEEDRLARKRKQEKRKIAVFVGGIAAAVCLLALAVFGYGKLPSTRYKKAVSMMEKGYYAEASAVLSEIPRYKDASHLDVECRFQQGLALFVADEYEQAHKEFWSPLLQRGISVPDHILEAAQAHLQQRLDMLISRGQYSDALALAANAFGEMTVETDVLTRLKDIALEKVTTDSSLTMEICDILKARENDAVAKAHAETLTEALYRQACLLLHEGGCREAAILAEYLGDYKDAPDVKSRAATGEQLRYLETLPVGGVGSLGAYEQDNEYENGKEPLEWIVLEKQDDSILLISKNVIDCRIYREALTATTWEESDLRVWLNGAFLNTAFSESDREAILTTTVVASGNAEYSVGGGNATEDRVFLLSMEEAETYFPKSIDRLCEVTVYAQKRAEIEKCNWVGQWLLRTPGNSGENVARILQNGEVLTSGFDVDRAFGIRPVIRIGRQHPTDAGNISE